MKKLFAVDIKRLLQNRIAIVVTVAAPLLLVLLISFVVAPYFYADVRTENFSVAVYNEDDDPLTVSILQGLIESDSLGGLIETRFVDSDQQGIAALEAGTAAYIHVPKNMQQELQNGGSAVIAYTGNPDMPLEDALLFETLGSGTELVSHAQHAVNMLYDNSVEAGIGKEAAAKAYQQTTFQFFTSVLSRDALYEETDTTSPLGGALPIEYYAASFVILFTALGALPIARITADDGATGLIHRQLLSGHTPFRCFVSRWLAGSVFLLIQYTVLTAALCLIAGAAFQFSGNVFILAAGGVLLCMFLSLGMMLAGLFLRSAAAAMRTAFLGAVALALLGGLLVPSAYMPALIRDLSYYTPFSAALRLSVSGMFDGRAGGAVSFALILTAYMAVLLSFGIKRFQRRTK